MLARAKLLQKDFKGAEAVLVKARETTPNSADPRIILGRFYTSQNRLPEAEAEFHHALQIDANNGLALLNLARLQNFLGRKHEAEQSFKRLASLKDSTYKSMYALFLFDQGRQDEAIREFERLVNEDPSDRLARTRLVSSYQAANRLGEAEKILDKALKVNNKDIDALLQRAEMFRAAGKYAEADADLNHVIRLQPDSGEMHYIMAKLHQARGATRSYQQQLSEALRLNPYLLSARLELVQQFLAEKKNSAASDVLNATPGSQKQLTPTVVQRNWVLWASDNMAEMRKGIDTGLSRERAPDLLVQDGVWKLRAGNAAAARVVLEEALNLNPSDLRAMRALNLTYAAQKQGGVALQKIKEYAARQPKSAPVQEFLGLMLLASGERAQARQTFEAAKIADPKFARADLSLAQMDVADGKLDDAQRRLDQLVMSDETNSKARLWLGNLRVMKGDFKAAMEHYRRVVAADSRNAQALNNLAFLLAEVGNQPVEALKYAQKAKELAPDSAEYSDTLGWILYRQRLYPMAVKELERAAAAQQGNPVWKYHLAMAYAKAGDAKRGSRHTGDSS